MTACTGTNDLVLSLDVNDEFWVAMHYEWDEKDIEKSCAAC